MGGFCKEQKTCHVCISVAGFVTLGVVINAEIVLHFELGAVVASHFDFSLQYALWHNCGTKMAPVPNLALMCLAMSYCEFRSLE